MKTIFALCIVVIALASGCAGRQVRAAEKKIPSYSFVPTRVDSVQKNVARLEIKRFGDEKPVREEVFPETATVTTGECGDARCVSWKSDGMTRTILLADGEYVICGDAGTVTDVRGMDEKQIEELLDR